VRKLKHRKVKELWSFAQHSTEDFSTVIGNCVTNGIIHDFHLAMIFTYACFCPDFFKPSNRKIQRVTF